MSSCKAGHPKRHSSWLEAKANALGFHRLACTATWDAVYSAPRKHRNPSDMFEMLVYLMDTARQLAKPRLVVSKGTHPASQESSVAMTCSSRTERSPTDLNGDFRTLHRIKLRFFLLDSTSIFQTKSTGKKRTAAVWIILTGSLEQNHQ